MFEGETKGRKRNIRRLALAVQVVSRIEEEKEGEREKKGVFRINTDRKDASSSAFSEKLFDFRMNFLKRFVDY